MAWSRTARRHQDFFTDDLAMQYFEDTFTTLANRVGSTKGLDLCSPITVRITRIDSTLALTTLTLNDTPCCLYSLVLSSKCNEVRPLLD